MSKHEYHELEEVAASKQKRDRATTDGDKEVPSSPATFVAMDHKHSNEALDRDSASENMNEQIEELAHRLTRASTTLESEMHALSPEPGSRLDPKSPVFDARAWVKAFIKLSESDPRSAPSRSLGVAFRNLNVFGWSSGAEYQKSAGNVVIGAIESLVSMLGRSSKRNHVEILRNFEGVVEEGELLLVLGPPGSGCSTLLKTIAGETAGLEVNSDAYMNFRGINHGHIRSSFRGDVLYNAEVDTHLAHLTVGETLTFAARARSVRHVPGGFTREKADTMMRDVLMAVFGLTHTINTRVGDDFVRGVSGGERKRVSIAEAALTMAKFQCWDNSTRGLDSANAINFCKNLRLQADLLDVAGAVAIYQAPQSAYDLFDRVTVLYEGRQIFFGGVSEAKHYFEELGFECKYHLPYIKCIGLTDVRAGPDRQTTPDFLTSMTSVNERRPRPGFENKVPRTPDEFAERWQASKQRQKLLKELDEYEKKHPAEERLPEYLMSRRAEQARSQRSKSPYTISFAQQVSLTLWRGYRRLKADPGFTIASFFFNMIMALILGSMFYDLKNSTSTFYYRGGLIFFALLFNAFSSQLEILGVYAERPVVEKHHRYAFYHQSAQALASFVTELPYKTTNMIVFNILIYFMAHLRREAGNFFFFCLTTYITTLVMSSLYRTLACVTRTSHQAMVPSSLLSLGLMIYTGFTIPTSYMPGWSRWMNYINPLAYAFEALMANEFHNRKFPCAQIVPQGPGYTNLSTDSQTCAVVGAEAGSLVADGDRYINLSFGYYNANKNVGILLAFLVFFFITYLVSAEFAKPPKSKGEVLVFRRGKMPSKSAKSNGADIEAQSQSRPVIAEKQTGNNSQIGLTTSTSVFHWEDLCYDIKIKGEERRILDHVDGWVKPGASTALMGVSGAGKTTLLDVLATRVTMGIVTGETLIDGSPTDASFQHRVGYVQQQDLHLNTMTVREALEFSALLRQSAEIPRQEKLEYVEHVISMLDMQDFADALIGVPGEGLNVEQRKRLTIGVELAARPQLLLFLDEPTSGLDSQTSWAICDLIEKLTKSGQAVLCTIHQPSAMLFQRFDRLLLLAPGGKTVYFGDLGKQSSELIGYFERNGAPICPSDANPAEWMLEVIKPSVDGSESTDWYKTWRDSPEYRGVKQELSRLRALTVTKPAALNAGIGTDKSQHQEFVSSFWTQLWEVLIRTSKHFWRSPTYIWSKITLIVLSSLYLGFSFSANNSIQGLQNQLYAIFMYLVLFGNINEQIMPMFVPQRDLYEVRERPSKIYRWNTFVLSNIMVEIAWNTLMAVIMYFCWYYPVGFVQNTTSDDVHIRGFLVFLFLWMYMLFTSTFSHFAISWIETPPTAGVLASLMWMLCISFCGVGVARADLPGFWNFMYRVSPGTYLVSGIMGTAVAGSEVTCAANEIIYVKAPGNMTCGDYLDPYTKFAGGAVLNPASSSTCSYCSLASTNEFLARFDISYGDRWRNFGLLWVYVIFNIVAAMGLYWAFRVPKGKGTKRA